MNWAAGSVLLLAGCSTAPIADLMDRFKPGRVDSAQVAPYGGVCNPVPGVTPGAVAGVLPPGPALPLPALPPAGAPAIVPSPPPGATPLPFAQPPPPAAPTSSRSDVPRIDLPPRLELGPISPDPKVP